MSTKLEINSKAIPNGFEISFTGNIDEDSDFSSIPLDSSKVLVFNFDKLKVINSCGIREWIKFLGTVKAGVQIQYKNCPQLLVEQINMVHGLLPQGAELVSLYAPYYCEDCDLEARVLISADTIKDAKAPAQNCPKCGKGPMEFDALENQYFHILKKKA